MLFAPFSPRLAPDTSENTWKPEDAVPSRVHALLTLVSLPNPSNYMLAFVQILQLLKTQKRTGWIDKGIPPLQVESIADHMYRMAVIVMAIPNFAIDTGKCARIALVHDIAEALVGDITPFGGVSKQEKHRREWDTICYLSKLIEPYNTPFSKELTNLWLDYEEVRTVEARYVKDIDKFELISQAWEYEQQFGWDYHLHEFYTARLEVVTPEIGHLCDEILAQRSGLLKLQCDDESTGSIHE